MNIRELVKTQIKKAIKARRRLIYLLILTIRYSK